MRCRECGIPVRQQMEKAIGSGEWAMVWGDNAGEWTCPVSGDEHVPSTDEPKRPVEVQVRFGTTSTMIRLSLAEYGNFMVSPMLDALDDGEESWQLQELDPERHGTLYAWASGLYGVTRN
jgi:hypothetical protein